MAFSQLLGLQERVEKVGEGGDRQDETEDGFKRHGVSLLFSLDSDLVAALHVPERQREETECQEDEEGIEHAGFLSERGDGAENEQDLVPLRERPVRSAEAVGGGAVVAALELDDQLRERSRFEGESRREEILGKGGNTCGGVVEVLDAQCEGGRKGRRGRAQKGPEPDRGA